MLGQLAAPQLQEQGADSRIVRIRRSAPHEEVAPVEAVLHNLGVAAGEFPAMPTGERLEHVHEVDGPEGVLLETCTPQEDVAQNVEAMMWRAAAYRELGQEPDALDCLTAMLASFEAAEREQLFGPPARTHLASRLQELGLKELADGLKNKEACKWAVTRISRSIGPCSE